MLKSIKLSTTLIRSVLIIILAVLIGIGYNLLVPAGIPIVNNYSLIKIGQDKVKIPVFLPNQETTSKDFAFHPPVSMNLKQAHENFYQGKAIFVDARSDENYKKGHIPGAISLPLNEIQPENLDLSNLNPEQKIIVYCDDPDCSLSMELAAMLDRKGLFNIYFFPGGWQEWQAAGYQTTK